MKGTYVRDGVRFRAGRRLWSAADDAVLHEAYADTPTGELARRLRRTLTATYNRAKQLGLEKSADYQASPAACHLRRGNQIGAATRFPRGHIPANKGLRRPGYSVGRGRTQQTQFTPGNRSGRAAVNWCPIGTIRTDPEGYPRIKVREAVHGQEPTGFGNVRVWPLLSRHVWTEAHGPIQPGHVVVVKNGNRTDVRLDNLELITRGALMARNTIHTLPKPLADTIRTLAAVRRHIRQRSDREKQD